ncbi:hypothetical protein [Hyphomicrobium sp. ghe19]|uniref:hypothetical protein n=1 Tax=Hyphomicrobium sp. ghe19 TaxID=2682968 RepID=UPI0013668BED|nr:hypothetical protein HYPP_01497 [Hyphomicrobium sp. ghe19]
MTSDATNSKPVNDLNLTDLRGEIKTRWIRTSVEMFEHPSLNFGPYDRRSAWMWLIANAAWKAREINHKGARLVLERGQVLIGRKFLAEKWGWTEQKVRTFVLRLCEDGMLEINQSNGHFANIATICNYEKYQTAQPERGQSNNQSLTSQQPEPNQTLTSNTNTTNLDSCQIADTSSVAAGGPNEISGLNGSTGLIVESMAHWLNPWAPDYPAAHKSIAEACRIYGPTIVRDAFAELKADHADGKVRALTHKAFYGYCRTAKERPATRAQQAPTWFDEERRKRSEFLAMARGETLNG